MRRQSWVDEHPGGSKFNDKCSYLICCQDKIDRRGCILAPEGRYWSDVTTSQGARRWDRQKCAFPLSLQKYIPADTLILDLWFPELREDGILNSPSFVIICSHNSLRKLTQEVSAYFRLCCCHSFLYVKQALGHNQHEEHDWSPKALSTVMLGYKWPFFFHNSDFTLHSAMIQHRNVMHFISSCPSSLTNATAFTLGADRIK